MPPKKIVPKKKEAAAPAPTAKAGAKSAAKAAAKSGAKASSAAPAEEKDQVDERLDGMLDELFDLYDKDQDGQIERVEMLEGEEQRRGGLDFGPKERKAAVTWFKEAGVEGNVSDGMFLSREKWKVAMKKLVEEGAAADEKKAAEEAAAAAAEDGAEAGAAAASKKIKPSDWVAEKYGKLWPKAKVGAVGAAGASGDAPALPAEPPVYPLTIAFKDLLDRLAEARAFKKQVLVVTDGHEQVETFINYRMYNTVDAKMYVSRVFGLKNMSLEDAQQDAKAKLTSAMDSNGFCKPLHVRLANSAPDWSRICCDGFPADLFDGELWSPEHAHKLGFFEKGHKVALELDDEKKWKEFHVILTSTFSLESANEFLADKIPHYDKLAILVIDPKSFG